MSETRYIPFDKQLSDSATAHNLNKVIASYLSSNSIIIDILCHRWEKLISELQDYVQIRYAKGIATEQRRYEELCRLLVNSLPDSIIHSSLNELIPHVFALSFMNSYDYRAVKKSECEKLLAMSWPHSAERATIILLEGNGIIWDPDFAMSFIKAISPAPEGKETAPWLKHCRLGCNYMQRDGGIIDIAINSYSIEDKIPITLMTQCTTLTLAALNTDFAIMLRQTQHEFKKSYQFLSDNHLYIENYSNREIANRAFLGLGKLIIAAEENKENIKDKLNACDKKSILAHLYLTLQETDTIPELKKLYDRYQVAQFLESKDNPFFDKVRDKVRESIFKEKSRFTKRKIAFVEALQQRACQIIAEDLSIRDKCKNDLDAIFSRDFIKHGISDRWIAKYEKNIVMLMEFPTFKKDTCCKKNP